MGTPSSITTSTTNTVSTGTHTHTLDLSGRNISTQHSLTGGGTLAANRTLNLVNDVATPGNSKYYGTNSGGTRGWYDLPAGGSTTLTATEIAFGSGTNTVTSSPLMTFNTADSTFLISSTNASLSFTAGSVGTLTYTSPTGNDSQSALMVRNGSNNNFAVQKSGHIKVKSLTAPSSGDAGFGKIWAQSNGGLYYSYEGNRDVDLTGMIRPTTTSSPSGSFSHDASQYNLGGYIISTTSAVTVSINYLSSGMQGTIFLNIGANNPSSITVNAYSGNGTGSLTTKVIGSAIGSTANKSTSITYTCVGSNVYLVYGREN
jgi:hypothetical protein